ncbi:MAG: response regulator [Chloroflexi bacterium]|nr:response regulator [Chloroflexota bacterium]
MGKILIADDEPGIRESLSRLLQADGHEVIEAEDGVAALELITSDKPDVLLLDNVMPKKDGIQVLEELRKHPATANLPVIMVTVKGAPKDRDSAVNLGVVDYINKPWMDGEIELRVKWALKGAGMVPAVPWDQSTAEGVDRGSTDVNRRKNNSPGTSESGPSQTDEDKGHVGRTSGATDVITPLEGGRVMSGDGRIRVDLPAGAVPESMALDAQRVSEDEPVIPATLRLKMGKTIADLTFTDRTGAPVEGVELDKPAKISIKYSEADLQEGSEKDLKIKKLNHETGRWVGMKSEVDSNTGEVSTEEKQWAKPPDRGDATVLVVDIDEEEMSKIQLALEMSGYIVLKEDRGEVVGKRVVSEKPDVVLLDTDMPRRDGYQLLRELKGNPETRMTSIIMTSATADQDGYAAAMTLGARDLIIKPWHTGDLQNRVLRAFKASRARAAQAERAVLRAKRRLGVGVSPSQRAAGRSGSSNRSSRRQSPAGQTQRARSKSTEAA